MIQVKGSKKVDKFSSSRFVDVGDKLKWRLNRSRFHVCSGHPTIQGTMATSFHWKSIWCIKNPKRVSFFIWTAA